MSAAPVRFSPLHALALLQGVAIAALAAALWRGTDAPPIALPDVRAPAAAAPTEARPGVAVDASASAPPAGAAAPAAPPAAAPADAARDSTRAEPTTTVLYGRIVDDTGAPVKECILWLNRAGDAQPVGTLSTNEQSPVFAIAGLAPGVLTWRTRATGYAPGDGTIEIPAAVPYLRRDFVLKKAWQLTVKILTPEGEPLHTAFAKRWPSPRGPREIEVGAVATREPPAGDFPPVAARHADFGLGRWRSATDMFSRMRDQAVAPKDVAGVLEIDERGPVHVSAVLRNRVVATVPVAADATEVALTVSTDELLGHLATARGRIVDDATGQPIAGASVEFSDQQSSGFGETADADGRFVRERLRPGLLQFTARSGSVAFAAEVLLPAGGTLDLGDVRIAAQRSIKVQCTGMHGDGKRCDLTWMPLDPPAHPAMRRRGGSVPVGANGESTLQLVDGRYLLRAAGRGGAVAEFDTRTLGDAPLVLALQPEAPLRLDLRPPERGWELVVRDAQERVLVRRDVRQRASYPVLLPLGEYRVELRTGDSVQTHRVTLGPDGGDLRAP